jgi:hypothetical protein
MIIPLDAHGSLWPLVPLVALFVIIFCCVLKAVEEMGIFRGPSKVAVAACVSILAVWGLDRTIIWPIVIEYQAMGLTLLIVLLILLLLGMFGRRWTCQEKYQEDSTEASWARPNGQEISLSNEIRQALDANNREKTSEFPTINKTLLSQRYSPIHFPSQNPAALHGITRTEDKPLADRVEGDDRKSAANASEMLFKIPPPISVRFGGSSPSRIQKSKRPAANCLREVGRKSQ